MNIIIKLIKRGR